VQKTKILAVVLCESGFLCPCSKERWCGGCLGFRRL